MPRRISLVSLLLEDDRAANAEQFGSTAPVATDKPLVPAQAVEIENASLDRKVDRYFIRYEREAIPQSSVFESLGRLSRLLEAPGDPPEEDEEPAQDDTLDDVEAGLGAADPAAGTDTTTPAPAATGADPFGGGGEEDLDFGGGGDPLGGGGLGGGGGGGFGGGGFDFGGDDMGGDEPKEKGSGPVQPDVNTPNINIEKFAAGVARLVANYDVLLDPKTTILNRARAYVEANYDESSAKYLMLVLDQNYGLKPGDQAAQQTLEPVGAGSGALVMQNAP